VQLPLIELPEMFRQSLGASTTPGWLGRHMLSLEIDVCIPDILFMHLDTICSEAHISQMFIAVGMCCLGGGGGGGFFGGGWLGGGGGGGRGVGG